MGEVRYAKSSGVHIAYQVVGDGPIDVAFIPGFVSNVEFLAEHPVWGSTAQRVGAFSRFILWDKRGTGLSDPVAGVPSLDDRVDDLEAVLKDAGSSRPALFGISEGGPMALLYAATRPQQVSALVLYGSTPKFGSAADWPYGWPPDQLQRIVAEIEDHWGEGRTLLDLFAPSVADVPAAQELWGRFQRASASPAMARAMIEAVAAIDCRPILPAITVPTLVVHRTGDRTCRVEAGRYLAEQIPGAVFVELPGDDHAIALGDGGAIFDAIEEFLTGVRRTPDPERVLATVLFTDVVDSTRHAARLGDQAWRQVLERHHAAVRNELGRFGGREVKTLGDGFLATFAGPSRAIVAACAIRDQVRELGVEVRAGLHTGECEVMGDDVAGLAVHTAARVAGLAGANEILVSSTVKDLVAGSGLRFAERGHHELKGVPGTWSLFSVT